MAEQLGLLQQVMIRGEAYPQNRERKGIEKDAFIASQIANQEDDGQGIEEDALIPAEVAGGEVQNLAEKQAAEGSSPGNGQRCEDGPFLGGGEYVDKSLLGVCVNRCGADGRWERDGRR